MLQVSYNFKLFLVLVGLLTAIASGFALVLNCSIFRWALQPCMGSQVYSQQVHDVIMTIGGISYLMIVLAWILPAKPVRDDYKGALS